MTGEMRGVVGLGLHNDRLYMLTRQWTLSHVTHEDVMNRFFDRGLPRQGDPLKALQTPWFWSHMFLSFFHSHASLLSSIQWVSYPIV
jgi:hypothetical protein